MAQVKVTVEEHLVKDVLVDVPDNITDAYERMDYAENWVKQSIKEEKTVLTADDWNGVRLFSVEDVMTGDVSDWHS